MQVDFLYFEITCLRHYRFLSCYYMRFFMNIQVKHNWFVFIGQQWLNALKVFFPPEIKFFTLLTINAFIKSWKLVISYFWWLLLMIPVLICLQSWINYSFYINPALICVQSLTIFVLFLAVRPSVGPKNYHYFFSFFKHGLYFAFYFLSLLLLGAVIFALGIIFAVTVKYGDFFISLIHFFSMLTTSVFLFSFFFFLDAPLAMKNMYKSFLSGIKITWYGFPFVFICLFIFNLLEKTTKSLIYGALYLASPVSAMILVYVIYFIFFSLLLCAFNVFYNKRVSEGFAYYF